MVRDGPANHKRLCVKGRFGFDYAHHPERLKKPLIRRRSKKGRRAHRRKNSGKKFLEKPLGGSSLSGKRRVKGLKIKMEKERLRDSVQQREVMKRLIFFKSSYEQDSVIITLITALGYVMHQV